MSRPSLLATLLCLGPLAGCGLIFGIEEGNFVPTDATSTGGGGGLGAGGSAGAATGGGGQSVCGDGDTKECFDADPSLAGVGSCKQGLKSCVDGQLGACEGQTLPQSENCDARGDEDCDGTACSDSVWVKPITATESAFAYLVDVGSDGSITIAGSFRGAMNLGDTPATLLTSATTSSFAATFESNGTLRWSRKYDVETLWISRLPNGGLLGSANFTGVTVLGGTSFTSAGQRDFAVFGINPTDGTISNVRAFGGPGDDTGRAYAFANGDFLVTGETDRTINFGGSFTAVGPQTDDFGAFVVRASPTGVAQWANVFEYSFNYGFSPPFVWPKVDGDALYLAVLYEHNLEGANQCGFFSGDLNNLQVTRLGMNGAPLWRSCANGNVSFRGLTADSTGAPAVLANLNADTHLDPAVGASSDPAADGGSDILIWKLGNNGSTTWTKQYGDSLAQGLDEGPPFGLVFDAADNLVLGSMLFGSADFGDGHVVSSAGDSDGILASIQPDGKTRWAKAIGGPGPLQTFFAVATDPNSSDIAGLMVSGAAIDFGTGMTYAPTSAKGIDMYLVKWQP